MHNGAFKPALLHQTRCKKPSLSYYHRVVNAALPQFLPCTFYHQFGTISTSSYNFSIPLNKATMLSTWKPLI